MKKERSIGEKLAGLGLAVAVSLSPNVPNIRDNSPNMPGNEAPIKENVVFAANIETAPPSPAPSPTSSPTPSPASLRHQNPIVFDNSPGE